jgi:hypothetical protein
VTGRRTKSGGTFHASFWIKQTRCCEIRIFV